MLIILIRCLYIKKILKVTMIFVINHTVPTKGDDVLFFKLTTSLHAF